MLLFTRAVAFSALLAFGFALPAPSFAQSSISGLQDFGYAIEDLERLAESQGVEITNIQISENIGRDAVGINTTSCTVTLTATVPGGSGIEVSATATTCSAAYAAASQQIADIIADLRRRIR